MSPDIVSIMPVLLEHIKTSIKTVLRPCGKSEGMDLFGSYITETILAEF